MHKKTPSSQLPTLSSKDAVVASSNTDVSIGSFQTYENYKVGIKMQYPTQWKLSEKEHYADHPDEKWNQVIGLSSPSETNLQSEKENFAIYVKRLLSPNMSLHEYVEKQISHLVRKSSLLESLQQLLQVMCTQSCIY